MSEEQFFELAATKLPQSPTGEVPVDLYVFLPLNKKYVKFIRLGTPINDELHARIKAKNLEILYSCQPLPGLTTDKPVTLGADGMPTSEIQRRHHNIDPDKDTGSGDKVFKNTTMKYGNYGDFDVISGGKGSGEALGRALKGLGKGSPDPEVISAFDQAVDQVLEIFNPESKTLKSRLIDSINGSNALTDSTLITKLAILFALPNGFDSKKPIRDLICATLLMDIPMKDLSAEDLKQYYTSKESLSPEQIKTIHEHPTKAHTIASQELPSATETTLQLILCHHELFNGKGFPRGLRTESVIPLVKILALATEVHENMVKQAYLEQDLSAAAAIDDLLNEKVDAHLRRHNRKVAQNVYDFTWGHLT